ELLVLLGGDAGPLAASLWSPLHLAMRSMLVDDEGVLRFSRDEIREAVRRRYLPGLPDEIAVRRRLAAYFARRRTSSRAAEELPWLLAEAGAWQELAAIFADPAFLAVAWQRDALDVQRLWTTATLRAALRLEDIYSPVIADPRANAPHAIIVGRLLQYH